MRLEAGFAENDFVNATKKILRKRTQPSTFPRGPGQKQGLELQRPGPGPGPGARFSKVPKSDLGLRFS